MNNIKKIGYSALAGSLVACSTNAVELSVSGKTEVTYSGKADSVNGNKWGSGNEITFSGSGDVNGMTATYTAVIADGGQANSNTSETFASSSLMLDMGDMGTIGFDQGTGAFGIGTIDDKMPSAYEEVWNGTTATTTDILDGNGGSAGVFGYKNTFMDTLVNIEYAPSVGSGDATDGGNSHVASVADGTSINFALTNSSLMDGLTVSASYTPSNEATEVEISSDYGVKFTGIDGLTIGAAAGEDNSAADSLDITNLYATYTMDSISVGYQASESDSEATDADKDFTAIGLSYAVSEDMSVSINSSTIEYEDATKSDQEAMGISVSYTMGSMSVKANHNTVDNVAGSATDDRSGYALTLGFAF